MSKIIRLLIALKFFIIYPFIAHAGILTCLKEFKSDIASTWNSDKYDLYIPLYMWHNPLAYTQNQINRYNEIPQGIGVGRSFWDEKENWHGLYIILFRDSNNNPESLFGYTSLRVWALNENSNFKISIGYNLNLTQRKESYYFPFLMPPSPMIGIEYRTISLQVIYLPGIKGYGNIVFATLKISLN